MQADYDGKRYTQHVNWRAGEAEDLGIQVLQSERGGGLSTEPGTIRRGNCGNSGYQAINLAVLLGATTVVLLGYDMQWTGGKLHWFGKHPAEVNRTQAPPSRFIADFDGLKGAPIDILNATRETALRQFPRVQLEELCGKP